MLKQNDSLPEKIIKINISNYNALNKVATKMMGVNPNYQKLCKEFHFVKAVPLS